MKLEKMIEELNEYCGNRLTITRYNAHWEIGAYDDKALFSLSKGTPVNSQTIEKAVVRAYNLMKKDKENKDG